MNTGARLARGVVVTAGVGSRVPGRATDGARERPTRYIMPLTLGLVCAVLVAAGFGLGVYLPNLHNGLIAATFTAVGILVLAKRPGKREALLFVATGLAHAVMFFGRQYGFYAADHPGTLPGARWVLWVGVWPLALVLVLVGITLMCFPDGRLPSPRWRMVVAAMLVVGALLSAASAVWPVEYADNAIDLPHPLDVPGYETAQQLWNVSAPPAYLLFQIAWAIAVVVRLRRAIGDEAKQLRWFAYAVTLSVAAMVAGIVVYGSPTLGVLVVPIVPLVAGAAIVKYRLYDIDLVIHKTLVLGAMAAAVITAGYVGVVVVVGRLAGIPAGSDPVLPLVATALVAIAFEPARRRARALADRLVYGDRPSPYDALARLSAEPPGTPRRPVLRDGGHRRRRRGRRRGDGVGRRDGPTAGGGVLAAAGGRRATACCRLDDLGVARGRRTASCPTDRAPASAAGSGHPH